VKTFLARTVGDWHNWLAERHDSETEVWLVFYKQHTGVALLDRKDALDEALCFGWVDSLVKRLDDQRYALKFTPRRADSRWSGANRQRYAELAASGRMQPAGLERPPTDRGYAPAPRRRPLPTKLPAYIDAALKKRPTALRFFDALPREERRRYVAWIDSAKREVTKVRRLKEAIRLLASGQKLGLK
jgi:uncharacterized protein YdeI (YjbR/CyaY-like superfamily)